ncbi:MAG: Lrp/AsnC family transcriptional regulator [archaeon]
MKVLITDNSKKSKVIFHKNDRKILGLLCHNIRLPVSKIAKLLSMSRQSVEYRINVMKKENLITGSRALINVRQLGYQPYHYFVNIPQESESQFVQRCNASDYVNALISYSGKWNYELSINSKSPGEANREFFLLTKDTKMVDYFPCILLETLRSEVLPKDIPEKIPLIKNIKNDPSFSKYFNTETKKYIPDKKDLEILYILSQDANASLTAMGRKVHLTKDGVSYRIKKLIQAKYILEFRPVINFDTLNFSVQALLVRASGRSKEEDKKFKDYIKNDPSILWATELFGSWDYLVYVLTESQEEIHTFISEARKKFQHYIQSYEILYAYQEHKYSFMTESMKE